MTDAAQNLRLMMAACYMDPRNKAAIQAGIDEIERLRTEVEQLRKQIEELQKLVLQKSKQVRAETALRIEAEKRLANPERYACDPIEPETTGDSQS